MGAFDIFVSKKTHAQENNYKFDLFQTVSNSTEIADMSAIKRYFNTLYDNNGSQFSSFNVKQGAQCLYVSQPSNKNRRLADYRSMAIFPEIASALDTICYSAETPDENNQLVTLNVKDSDLESEAVQEIIDAAQEYFDLFDFDNNFIEYFRKFIIDGQLCWENIVAKDDLEQGIIDINFIPTEAYEFCYDTVLKKKMGIMITSDSLNEFNIFARNGITVNGLYSGTSYDFSRLNCANQLEQDNVIVLPFEQLTYVDSRYLQCR